MGTTKHPLFRGFYVRSTGRLSEEVHLILKLPEYKKGFCVNCFAVFHYKGAINLSKYPTAINAFLYVASSFASKKKHNGNVRRPVHLLIPF